MLGSVDNGRQITNYSATFLVDIDECTNTTACGEDSELKRCVNNLGSFNCYCKNGYSKEGDRCAGIYISWCMQFAVKLFHLAISVTLPTLSRDYGFSATLHQALMGECFVVQCSMLT